MNASQWRKSKASFQVKTELVELTKGNIEIARISNCENATPLLFFHGWPSSLCQAYTSKAVAEQQQFELISVNRPGIGKSTPYANFQMSDWPQFMAELLDQLEMEKAAVLGVSGGGPYALACGALRPESFPQISIVCSAPPMAGRYKNWRKEIAFSYQILAKVVEKSPRALAKLAEVLAPFAAYRPPCGLLQLGAKALCASDQNVIQNLKLYDYSFGSFQQAVTTGRRHVIEEGVRYIHPWGFDLEEVQVPVTVWHGKHDKNFHWKLAKRVAEALPQGRLELHEDQGHYSIPMDLGSEIFADLRRRWDSM